MGQANNLQRYAEGVSWQDSVRAGDTTRAISEVEVRLSELPTDPSARLWWLALQLDTDSLPRTALAAPAEELAPVLKDSAELREFACVTFGKLAEALSERKQNRLAAAMIMHAVTFAKAEKEFAKSNGHGNNGSGYHFKEALAPATKIIQGELQRAETKRESAAYLSKLKATLSEIETVTKEIPRTSKEKTPPAFAPSAFAPSEAETITTEALKISEDGRERGFTWGDPADLSDPTVEKDTFSFTAKVKPKVNRNLLIGGAVTIALAVVSSSVYTVFRKHDSIPEGLQLAYALPLPKLADISPIQPKAPLPAADPLNHRISMLSTSLSNMGDRLKNIGNGGNGDEAKQNNTPDPEVDHDALESKEAKALHGASPSGNVISKADDELVAFGGGPKEQPTLDPKKAPLLDPAKLGEIPIDTISSEPRASQVANNSGTYNSNSRPTISDNGTKLSAEEYNKLMERTSTGGIVPELPGVPSAPKRDRRSPPPGQNMQLGGLTVGPDGQLYGTPRSLPEQQPPSGYITGEEGVAMDGGPVRAYEVQRFPEPRKYRTIVSTQVVSSPSMTGVRIDRIGANTTIIVTSRLGEWLELRSRSGRRGFIFAQDAVQE